MYLFTGNKIMEKEYIHDRLHNIKIKIVHRRRMKDSLLVVLLANRIPKHKYYWFNSTFIIQDRYYNISAFDTVITKRGKYGALWIRELI